MDNGPGTLMDVLDVRDLVREIRWEINDMAYNDMSPVLLPLLTNLSSLALHCSGQFDDHPIRVPKVITRVLRNIKRLTDLSLEQWNSFEDDEFDIGDDLPLVSKVTTGSWLGDEQWEGSLTHVEDLFYTLDCTSDFDVDEPFAVSRSLLFLKELTISIYPENKPYMGFLGLGQWLSDGIIRDHNLEATCSRSAVSSQF